MNHDVIMNDKEQNLLDSQSINGSLLGVDEHLSMNG